MARDLEQQNHTNKTFSVDLGNWSLNFKKPEG